MTCTKEERETKDRQAKRAQTA